MPWKDEDRWRSPAQRDNWGRRTKWNPWDENQRGHTKSWGEHRWRDEGAETGKTEVHKLEEKLENLTRRMERLVQR